MTTKDKQLQFFRKLTADREDSVRTIEKPSMAGVKGSVVEKYTDQAHFIYELLQNADDAQATKAKFHLTKNGLYFTHNGSVHFSVTAPENESTDKQNGILGHVNSITSIGQSNKTTESTIGKFGVGFKAVFQYTDTPHIYDRYFQFKIERFIVPQLLPDDYPERKNEETVFFFPFDKPTMPPAQAFTDIFEKLKSLIYPTLFLSNLKEVLWETENEKGEYVKDIIESTDSFLFYEKISLIQDVNDEIRENFLFLFTGTEPLHNKKYSVGYFLDETRQKLKPTNHAAFCFFPTKEQTNLKFIIHAPFLLTDSREGIKAGVGWNKELINYLSKLARNSLIVLKQENLIDDDIVNIIPYKESDFGLIENNNKISFKPFYLEIKEKFKTEEILPAKDGTFARKDNAYWAQYSPVTEIINNKQLASLTAKPDAKWVFPSIGRNDTLYRRDPQLGNYIDDLIHKSLDIETILRSYITTAFIEAQEFNWLHQFYEYIAKSNEYIKIVKTKPIFKNAHGKAVAAFEQNGKEFHPILFLPTAYIDSPYQHIHPELLEDEQSKEFIINFGIDEPDLKDEIYNKILPQYDTNEIIDTKLHFQKFFKYYKEECPQDKLDGFINLIKDKKFILCSKKNNGQIYPDSAKNLYYPSPELKEYFDAKPDTPFLHEVFYHELVEEKDKSHLKDFFLKIGVSVLPRIIQFELVSQEEKYKRKLSYSTRESTAIDKLLDGCAENILNPTLEKSKSLWDCLLKYNNIEYEFKGEHKYFYRTAQFEFFESVTQILLKLPWLISKSGDIVAPRNITINDLSDEYEKDSNQAQKLMQFLQFKPSVLLTEKDIIAQITQGRTPEEVQEALNLLDRQNAPQQSEMSDSFNQEADTFDKTVKTLTEYKNKNASLPKTTKSHQDSEEKYKDEDDYQKPVIDFDKEIQRKQDRLIAEIDDLTKIKELTETAQGCEKYSFLWFKSLLELELLNSNRKSSNDNEISIQFTKVEKEHGTERTIILKHPNRYIPQSIEDIGDLTIKLSYGEETRSITIEVVNVKEFTLRAKLKSSNDVSDIDLSKISKAVIDIQNPIFLLEELRKSIERLPYDDTDNLKQKLTPNIEFIFGPPGTGKTTYLAGNILIPLMEERANLKILVLTPTNKAADVLVKRIIEVMKGDDSYHDWLVRFGITGDADIEQSPIFKDKSFNLNSKPKNVTVTTIARFPYDYFNSENSNSRLYLREVNWDYIVIDEASMIPIANIIFPLHYKSDAQFIIAGDPFQIQPIAQVKDWKDENIYTLVGLNKFSNPTTTPYSYNIINLTTQYRSVPSIGNVFSNFIYNGVLNHHREEASQRELKIDGMEIKSLNIIKFPVSPFDSIYRPKRLHKTPYHIYSALFGFELLKYLSEQIIKNHIEAYRIGVICPYKAQASLLEKLFASMPFDTKNVDIQIGTIHSFQGDECDIIISLFNPPPKISNSPDMFLNKPNILNVSISRARDYLFILMPDEKTENLESLEKLNNIERLIKESGEKNYTEIHSQIVEHIIFKNSRFIEENSFSTSHQLVNVYSVAEKLYEIRCEETAIDIQVGKK